ncbi:MAG: sigma-70 family RNA polymerase sigma factor [Candidatus Goldbacteria bacterium]|nr:sigma-70 family RNA polymerase sigma factor [Candidatus Goldiibacteriota bacterium]
MREIDIKEVKKAQKGDKKAFDNIITFYRETVIDICYKYLRNRDDALDMAQEVFYSVYNSIKSFEFKSRFSTWIYRICVNLCINKLDKYRRRKYYETESLDEEKDDSQHVNIPNHRDLHDRQIEYKETRELIMKQIAYLSEKEQKIFILRDIQGFEYKEISEIMKLPLGSIKSTLNRAREKIKEKLIKYGV